MVGHLAEVTVEGGAGDDGRGHDDEAEHDEAVDEEVLEAVPPATVRGQTSSLGVEIKQSYGGAMATALVVQWLSAGSDQSFLSSLPLTNSSLSSLSVTNNSLRSLLVTNELFSYSLCD